MLNYLLGKYITIGFHKPNAYPKKHFLSVQKNDTLKVMTPEQMKEFAKRFTSKLNGNVNGKS